MARGGKDPFIVVKNPSASKGGVAETSIKVRCKLTQRLLASVPVLGLSALWKSLGES